MACRDRFLHQLSASLRQWPYAAPAQIPQPLVAVARVNKNDAFTCGRVGKSGTRMFREKLKERLPPRSIRIIKHFFAKFLEFFNADDSDRFRDRFPPLLVDSFSVLEFFKWHGTPSLVDSSESGLTGLYSSQWMAATKGASELVNQVPASRFGAVLVHDSFNFHGGWRLLFVKHHAEQLHEWVSLGTSS